VQRGEHAAGRRSTPFDCPPNNYAITQLPDYPIPVRGISVAVVMDADRMGRTLTRIAHEILERNRGV